MYIPSALRVEDPEKLGAFMRRYSFATLITHEGAAPFASHLPVLYSPEEGGLGVIVSHMARANPQWRHFAAGGEALAIFHGPHCYVSPSWYAPQPAVPTWNYAVVHAYGVPALITDHDRIMALLEELVSFHEAGFEKPWPAQIPAEYRDRMIQGIVAFELRITRIEGKYKLSQTRSEADRQSVAEALSQSADAESRAVAELMVAEEASKK